MCAGSRAGSRAASADGRAARGNRRGPSADGRKIDPEHEISPADDEAGMDVKENGAGDQQAGDQQAGACG